MIYHLNVNVFVVVSRQMNVISSISGPARPSPTWNVPRLCSTIHDAFWSCMMSIGIAKTPHKRSGEVLPEQATQR